MSAHARSTLTRDVFFFPCRPPRPAVVCLPARPPRPETKQPKQPPLQFYLKTISSGGPLGGAALPPWTDVSVISNTNGREEETNPTFGMLEELADQGLLKTNLTVHGVSARAGVSLKRRMWVVDSRSRADFRFDFFLSLYRFFSFFFVPEERRCLRKFMGNLLLAVVHAEGVGPPSLQFCLCFFFLLSRAENLDPSRLFPPPMTRGMMVEIFRFCAVGGHRRRRCRRCPPDLGWHKKKTQHLAARLATRGFFINCCRTPLLP